MFFWWFPSTGGGERRGVGWKMGGFAMFACVQHVGLPALPGWTKLPALLESLHISGISWPKTGRERKKRRRAAKNLIGVGGWSQGSRPAGCCGVLTWAEQLWVRGDALGSFLGCHSSTSPSKFCCPSTGWPLQLTPLRLQSHESSGGILPILLLCPSRHPAGDKQRL